MKSGKRNMTKSEIEWVLGDIGRVPNSRIPKKNDEYMVELIKSRLREQLIGILIYPECIQELRATIKNKYEKSKVEPGEMVGIICAQSIGEKNTQLTLNHFHKAGSAEGGVHNEVSRISEILNTTKTRDQKNISVNIKLKHQFKDIKDLKNYIGTTIKMIKFADCIKSYRIMNISKNIPEWYNMYDKCRKKGNFVRVYLNQTVMYTNSIDIKKIKNLIETTYSDLTCIVSPQVIGEVDIFMVNKTEEKIDNEKLFFHMMINNIKEIIVDGINNISEIYFYRGNDRFWNIETTGGSLQDVFQNPIVDKDTTTNNIWDILKILGIEAAKSYIISDLQKIMPGVDISHIKLLVNKITFNGSLSSISRYTLRKDNVGVLHAASFEESIEHFIKASATTSTDDLKSISSSIMCGKMTRCGTGLTDLVLDYRKVIEKKRQDRKCLI